MEPLLPRKAQALLGFHENLSRSGALVAELLEPYLALRPQGKGRAQPWQGVARLTPLNESSMNYRSLNPEP